MRFHNIQVLRVVAAVAVVLAHLCYYSEHLFGARIASDWLREGTWRVFPVPLFFAVSGFVLTHALHAAPRGRFLLARFLRLYPGYWLAVVLVLPLIWFTVWPADAAKYVSVSWVAWSLRPRPFGSCLYVLGVEWSLVYEVFLSVALFGMSLLGLRRGLPVAASLWLAVLGTKAVLRPGYCTDVLADWYGIGLSAFNVPFLLGVVVYYLKDRGGKWRWPVMAVLCGFVGTVPARGMTLEQLWIVFGIASATAVWAAVQLRQVSDRNVLTRLGDCTYGLYLVHVPIMTGTFYLLAARGWLPGSTAGAVLAGIAALTAGLIYGRLESAIHKRLRPLARMEIGKLSAWPRTASRTPVRLPGRAAGSAE